jgi:hypothetical protein
LSGTGTGTGRKPDADYPADYGSVQHLHVHGQSAGQAPPDDLDLDCARSRSREGSSGRHYWHSQAAHQAGSGHCKRGGAAEAQDQALKGWQAAAANEAQLLGQVEDHLHPERRHTPQFNQAREGKAMSRRRISLPQHIDQMW